MRNTYRDILNQFDIMEYITMHQPRYSADGYFLYHFHIVILGSAYDDSTAASQECQTEAEDAGRRVCSPWSRVWGTDQ